jgi:hypothetical protein
MMARRPRTDNGDNGDNGNGDTPTPPTPEPANPPMMMTAGIALDTNGDIWQYQGAKGMVKLGHLEPDEPDEPDE